MLIAPKMLGSISVGTHRVFRFYLLDYNLYPFITVYEGHCQQKLHIIGVPFTLTNATSDNHQGGWHNSPPKAGRCSVSISIKQSHKAKYVYYI